MVLRKDTIYYQAFLLCTFTTTTGSDNFRKPEFFPSRTWVFFGHTWVFSWMDLSFPQIDKRSCQIWSKTPFPGRFWVVFHWFFSKSRLYTILCELKTPENSAFEENSTWVFSKTWVFFGDLSFPSAQKKACICIALTNTEEAICCRRKANEFSRTKPTQWRRSVHVFDIIDGYTS